MCNQIFGVLPSGEQTTLYTISCGHLQASITDYGAHLVSLLVPDKTGIPADVVLGYDDPKGYRTGNAFLGAIVGRNANRIKGSRFPLGNGTVRLTPNEGENNLHSGPDHFHLRLWQVVSHSENSITLSWNRSSGAKGYKIYLYNAQKKKWKRLATTAKTSYTLKELTTGKKYKLAVRAYAVIDSKELLSAYEPFVCSTRPATPNVSVGTAKNGKVQVKWSAVKGADGYQIYYSTKKNEGYKKLTDQVKASYTVNAKSKKTYYIRVRAYVKTDAGKVYGSFSGVRKI